MRKVARAVGAALGATLLGALGAGCADGPRDLAVDLPLSGDLRAHDPALVVDDGDWWVFSTGDPVVGGGAIQVRHSDDGREWTYAGEVAPGSRPAWIEQTVPGVTNLWAPDVVEHDGTWYLYYAASTFGSNRSAIGLMTADAPGPGDGWADRGPVVVSDPDQDDWNAIDPAVVTDDDGTPWMAFGSFWGGIQLLELSWPSGLPADGATPVTIADRGAPPNAIEGASLLHRDGWWYLLVSKDFCCRATASTYRVEVGRSRDITGPYVDADGRSMLEDGGTILLSTDGDMIGPGGESVWGEYLAFHYYDGATGGAPHLAIRELGWTDDGWPVAVTEAPVTSTPQVGD
ncbi:arabinan endo-1,5-alpha-L-arabinosidase [Actinotalea sp. M2MS4P-6]|uniref:arabinan endo-1,5-alpha-L-arabinosidase n=1 Tax=Actinotalea sp. M2MS4P-6 TaxID=2983762 RepID=UPI0021E4B665|nr:arabinan endo-1,5-alpha-L-arabinosidase [Actinotalea sp. M2MS4P-6]MCV2394862.1 arabinan endo-1,5-alpha-L-arabinosidase [Actinotalea sp. M2MS4P-6]